MSARKQRLLEWERLLLGSSVYMLNRVTKKK